ncbi:MAG: 5-(carboxyamino)imidazole ribonucleotide mutase [Candidatus Cloacimonadota bacterium]|nr:MAG: 5-(carboxyamino)imidazole ribonucleotide mutase [Candidatus Cloacimonadota bacterium]
MPQVRIILGSKSDIKQGEKIKEFLEKFGVEYDFYVSSAHRKPEQTANLAKNAEKEGIKVIIAAAGMAAHLPGVIASHTVLPVIGVPLSGSALSGEDALFSVVQMPTGVPVATVAIDGGKNAAVLASQIIAVSDENVKSRLKTYKKELSEA